MGSQYGIAGVLAVILLGGGWFFFSNQNSAEVMTKEDDLMEKTGDGMMVKEIDGMMEKKSGTDMMESKTGDAQMDSGDTMMKKTGSYSDYAPEKLALANEGTLVLFFHAPWCPSCRSLDSEIRAKEGTLSGVHLLKVDFDTATALRQKYGVTVQHTFVRVDAQGTLIAKWSDATTLSGVLSKVQ